MQQGNNDDLFARFKSTSEKDLEKAIPLVDGLDSKSYDDAKRASNHRLNESWNKLKSSLHRIAEYSIFALTLIFFFLLSRFIWDVLQDSEQTKLLLKDGS